MRWPWLEKKSEHTIALVGFAVFYGLLAVVIAAGVAVKALMHW